MRSLLRQHAQGLEIVQAFGENSTATVTITGLTSKELQDALRAAGESQQATINSLSTQFEY
jgi:hypothetical protein